MTWQPPPAARASAGRALAAALLLGLCASGVARAQSADEEPPVVFSYSLHSTLGLLELEVPTVHPESVEVRVPNRGFSQPLTYIGYGRFGYRLVVDDRDDQPPAITLDIPRQWLGRHVYFFAFKGGGESQPIRLAPMLENSDFKGDGAIVFGNFSDRPLAAKLGEQQLRARPGQTLWLAAPDAPEGMQTLLVQIGADKPRPIYRNRIPIRSEHRLFILVVPGAREGSEKLLVAYDRNPGENRIQQPETEAAP